MQQIKTKQGNLIILNEQKQELESQKTKMVEGMIEGLFFSEKRIERLFLVNNILLKLAKKVAKYLYS